MASQTEYQVAIFIQSANALGFIGINSKKAKIGIRLLSYIRFFSTILF